MKTITTELGSFIAVEVPKGSFNFKVMPSFRRNDSIDLLNSTLVFMHNKDHQGFEHLDNYPGAKLEIIGLQSDILKDKRLDLTDKETLIIKVL